MARAPRPALTLIVAMAATACTQESGPNVLCPFQASEKVPKGRDMEFGSSWRDVVDGLQGTSHDVSIEWSDSDEPALVDRFTWSWRLRGRPERGRFACRIGTGESNDEVVRGGVVAELESATGASGTGGATLEIDPVTGARTLSGTVTLTELSGTPYADFDLNDDRLSVRFDASAIGLDPAEGEIRTSNPSRRVGLWQR